MAVIICKEVSVPSLAPPVGTTWLYEEDGTFEVPATGNYEVELHGGGGAAAFTIIMNPQYPYTLYSAGGGSGQLFTVSLSKGETIEISIGVGGTAISGSSSSNPGGQSSFGEYASVSGGGGGNLNAGGSSSGNIATSGEIYKGQLMPNPLPSGGLGNSSKPGQTYGNGGGFSGTSPQSGQPGACIITFLGVS